MSEDITVFKGKIKLQIHRTESGKTAAFLTLNASAEVWFNLRCIRQTFYERLTTSLRVEQMYPFSQLHQNMQLGEKPLWGVRAEGSLWNEMHCWTTDCAAKTTAVESDWNSTGCPVSGSKSLWSVSADNKSFFFFCFFQLHTVVQLFFNTRTIFKT